MAMYLIWFGILGGLVRVTVIDGRGPKEFLMRRSKIALQQSAYFA